MSLVSGVWFSEFSERSEQPSAPDFLRFANRTASPQLHRHHVSTSVSRQMQKYQQKILSSLFKFVFYSVSWFPVLRDALLLIERQSGALQTHTELFLSSILSAMDCLTQPSQPSPVQKCGADDLHPVEIQGSTMWTDCYWRLVDSRTDSWSFCFVVILHCFSTHTYCHLYLSGLHYPPLSFSAH